MGMIDPFIWAVQTPPKVQPTDAKLTEQIRSGSRLRFAEIPSFQEVSFFAVTGFKGVEGVTVDNSNNKLTVVGKLNPEKIRSSVENKIKKKVELVSPLSENDKSGENKKGSGRVGEKDQANGELINVDPNKYGGAYLGMYYPIENVHHPSNFNHENSNVCSVM
ncbi:uncharacterized protein LOC131230522 [Magnolia sinica]|uniref:uncharacterized protein LOC131230522 n=1 Tax=Magnolia sinica TaxID=86752 RepID=UPI002657AE7B|nr:uncharacterized protein LOC131230522 [Magnolia sinica]